MSKDATDNRIRARLGPLAHDLVDRQNADGELSPAEALELGISEMAGQIERLKAAPSAAAVLTEPRQSPIANGVPDERMRQFMDNMTMTIFQLNREVQSMRHVIVNFLVKDDPNFQEHIRDSDAEIQEGRRINAVLRERYSIEDTPYDKQREAEFMERLARTDVPRQEIERDNIPPKSNDREIER